MRWRSLPPKGRHQLTPLTQQADKLQSLISAAKVPDVEPIWTTLFAKALEGKDVKDLLTNVGSGGGAAPAAAGGAAPAAGGDAAAADAPAEKAKEEGKFFFVLQISEFFLWSSYTDWDLLQRRRSPTTTWASVSSTKRVASVSPTKIRECNQSRSAKGTRIGLASAGQGTWTTAVPLLVSVAQTCKDAKRWDILCGGNVHSSARRVRVTWI